MHILFKQQKKLTLFLLGGFSLLAGLILILTATLGAKPARASDLPSPVGSTITFDKQGGTGGTSSLTFDEDAYIGHNVGVNATPINGFVAPTRNGYKFLGYYMETTFNTLLITQNGTFPYREIYWFNPNLGRNEDITNCCDEFVIKRDFTVYAKWEELPAHTIALPPQSGEGWVLL